MNRLLSIFLIALMLPVCALATGFDAETEAMAILNQLMAGDVDAYYDRLSPEVQAAAPRDMLTSFADQLTAVYGAFEGWGSAQVIGMSVSVEARFAQENLVAQVTFDGNEKVIGLGFVPMTATQRDTSLAENEEAVSVGPKGLAGVLTLPVLAEGEQAPVVVLVHGSGPNDRNEALGATAIFRDIAEGLSAQGIAVLRYDKRTYAMNTGAIAYELDEIANMTVYEETIEDAVAAVHLLKEDARIDPERVFILGHSQGGMLAGRMQQAGAGASGLISLAGTLRHLGVVIVDQFEALDQGTGSLTAEIATAKALPEMTEAEAREATILGVTAYSFWEEMQHDLIEAAESTDVPILVLQGTEDRNVYADIDYVLWEEFAAEHPDRDMEFHLYEGVDHSFVGGDGRFIQQVLDDIIHWVNAH